MPDNVFYIEAYLSERFQKLYSCSRNNRITVGDYVERHPYGTYLITMRGHITCAENGIIYDTFDPSDRFVWSVYKV